LIYSLGGTLGVLSGNNEGLKLLAEMKKHTMNEVRCLINTLIEKEYDSKTPVARTEQEILIGREVSSNIMLKLSEAQKQINELLAYIHQDLASLIEMTDIMQNSLIPSLSNIPFKAEKSGVNLINDFDSLLKHLKELYALCTEDRLENPINDADNQNFAIDSDEEERLYRELDLLMESQERAEAFKGNAHKFMANSVQKAFRAISDLQNSFQLVNYLV
jgi:hypothetical protein